MLGGRHDARQPLQNVGVLNSAARATKYQVVSEQILSSIPRWLTPVNVNAWNTGRLPPALQSDFTTFWVYSASGFNVCCAEGYPVGDVPSIADVCYLSALATLNFTESLSTYKNTHLYVGPRSLIPQLYNARRFEVDVSALRFPALLRVEAACSELEAFRLARPDMRAASAAERLREIRVKRAE
ncbi:hypothetical protein AK812_SmicGene27915 [Symbiodinium microadriaticum]|uniref:Uncharacterized protein n=1 Tax=Symbiodinium microadriaticum TaxID=2951 RepID=A0A1Q9D5Q3_SYMMI|nr:hypothetical protein AK812_SmicGene27915 [Symbiodinium microadriaticum]